MPDSTATIAASYTTRWDTIGECIYCQEPSNVLTEEHVIPSGLGGWRTLPRASCERCQNITREFETVALRHVLGPGRYWLGIPPKKGKRRPDAAEVRLEPTDLRIEALIVWVIKIYHTSRERGHGSTSLP